MTNEELVREIQSGKTEKMSELWEQVRRYVWQQASLNCQSEVRIFGVKTENNPKFTLTKGRVLYIDISRFSEPEGAATNEVGTTLTGY